MQRRERKADLSVMPSARALIIRLPMAGSLAQVGIRPQRTVASSRPKGALDQLRICMEEIAAAHAPSWLRVSGKVTLLKSALCARWTRSRPGPGHWPDGSQQSAEGLSKGCYRGFGPW